MHEDQTQSALIDPEQLSPATAATLHTLQLEFIVVRPFLNADTTQAYHRVIRIESPNDQPNAQDWTDAERHLRLRLEHEGLQDALYFQSDADYSDLPADVTAIQRR